MAERRRQTAIQRVGSNRANRISTTVFVLGIVLLLFAVPRIPAGPENAPEGASAIPNLGAAAVRPYQPTQVDAHSVDAVPHSVDAVLAFVTRSGIPAYSFRGHSPRIPMPVGAPLPWAWFSGNPADPNLANPAEPLDTAGATKQVRVSFSREGYAVAVWDSESVYGDRICSGSTEQTNVTKTDIKFSVFRDTTGAWTVPVVAAAAPADPGNPLYNEAFTHPVIAIDSNGNGLLVYAYWRLDPCGEAPATREIRYSIWTGGNSSFQPSAVLEVSAPSSIFSFEPLAVAFSAHLAAADGVTRQDGIVTWWEAVDLKGIQECPPGPPVSVPRFWPRYAHWNGSGFDRIDDVPGRREAGSGRFESLEVRSGMAASPDQLGRIGIAFPVSTKTDLCVDASPSREVWRAIWNSTTETWTAGTKVDDGGHPSLAYGTDPSQERARVVYQVPDPPQGGIDPIINRSTLDGMAITNVGQVDDATGFTPTIAHLAHDTALVVWSNGTGDLRFWQRVGGAPPVESVDPVGAAGTFPFLAARTGSPQVPHAEWTYFHYMAHDDLPANMTLAVLNRLQSVGSTNLVNVAILLDESDNASHVTDFYVKQRGRTPLQDHGELNLAAQATLQEFIARTIERYPARGEYFLVLEDHGNGWRGVCSDDRPATGDWIEPTELRGALSAVNISFQIVVLNACLMGNVETVFQFEGFARFLVASQESMPLSVGDKGMRYDQLLDRLIADPQRFAADPRSLADSIVADYSAANAGRDYALASIQVENLRGLVNAITAFRNLVVPMIDQSDPKFDPDVHQALQADRKSAQVIRRDPGVRDLFHFFFRVRNNAGLSTNIQNASEEVLNWQASVISREWSEDGPKPNARGLNIWFDPWRITYNVAEAAYRATRFAEMTSWHDVVRHLSETQGILLTLKSPNPDLFLRAQDRDQLEVGTYSKDETCTGFCNSQISSSSCSKLGGSTTIFLPGWGTPVNWFVDGTLLQEPANYSLSLQEVTTDPAGNTVVLFSQNSTGTVERQQFIAGQFVPDQLPPLTNVRTGGTPGDNGWWRSSVTVTLTVQDDGHGVNSTFYSVDSGPDVFYREPFTVSGEGYHRIEYFSIDKVGNDELRKRTDIWIDTVAPVVTFTAACFEPGEAGWCRGSAFVNLSASDSTSGVAGIEVSLDGSEPEPYRGPQPVVGDGTHQVDYFATDIAGNPSRPATREVLIDGTPPTVLVNLAGALGNDDWYRSVINFTLTPTDTTSGIAALTIRVGSGPEVPYVGPVMIGSEGLVSVEIAASDLAGNRATLVTSMKIDRTPPAFQFVLPVSPGGTLTTPSLSIALEDALDPTSGIAECSIVLDDGSAVTLDAGVTRRFDGLPDGAHTVEATCVDVAGNVETKTVQFTVDTGILSLGGPYAPWSFIGFLAVIAAGAVAAVFWLARRRRRALFLLSRRKGPSPSLQRKRRLRGL